MLHRSTYLDLGLARSQLANPRASLLVTSYKYQKALWSCPQLSTSPQSYAGVGIIVCDVLLSDHDLS